MGRIGGKTTIPRPLSSGGSDLEEGLHGGGAGDTQQKKWGNGGGMKAILHRKEIGVEGRKSNLKSIEKA